MPEKFPRQVFRVMYHKDRTPFVTERKMVSRSGSWFVTERKDGTQQKENGNYWSDTILEAIQREASHIMHRFTMPGLFSHNDQLASMNGLIREAMEWGVLLGECQSSSRAADAGKGASDA